MHCIHACAQPYTHQKLAPTHTHATHTRTHTQLSHRHKHKHTLTHARFSSHFLAVTICNLCVCSPPPCSCCLQATGSHCPKPSVLMEMTTACHLSSLTGYVFYVCVYVGMARTTYIYGAYTLFFWQRNHQIYGHIRCIYTVLVNPVYMCFACECVVCVCTCSCSCVCCVCATYLKKNRWKFVLHLCVSVRVVSGMRNEEGGRVQRVNALS